MAVMMPSVAPVLRSGVQDIMQFAEFMRQVGEDRVEWRPLPWPVIEGGAMHGAANSR